MKLRVTERKITGSEATMRGSAGRFGNSITIPRREARFRSKRKVGFRRHLQKHYPRGRGEDTSQSIASQKERKKIGEILECERETMRKSRI